MLKTGCSTNGTMFYNLLITNNNLFIPAERRFWPVRNNLLIKYHYCAKLTSVQPYKNGTVFFTGDDAFAGPPGK